MRRYGSVNVPVTSIGVIVYGAIMLFSTPSSFLSPAYTQGPFRLVPREAWAVGFIAAGIVALAMRHLLAVFPLLMMTSGWAFALGLAAATADGVTPTAGLSWFIIAVELLISVSIRGFRPKHLARSR